jgi:tryptophanyl-tRNA synthetase
MDLQNPTAKMSKSADSPQGTIALLDDPKAITKRIKSAVTDSETEVRYDPQASRRVEPAPDPRRPRPVGRFPEVEAAYSRGGYGGLKTDTADAVVEFLAPLQARYHDLAGDPAPGRRHPRSRSCQGDAISDDVLARVRRAVGLLPRA